MVRRRGTYEVIILQKQLTCTFCGGTTFSHREVYMDLCTYDEEVTERLTLQSLSCTHCSDTRLFQEKEQFDEKQQQYVSTITYKEVMNDANR